MGGEGSAHVDPKLEHPIIHPEDWLEHCGQAGKRHRIREALLWQTDAPAHFAPAGGLLSFALDLPDDLTGGFAPLNRQLRETDAGTGSQVHVAMCTGSHAQAAMHR